MAKVFESIEMNWNPNMMKYNATKFGQWKFSNMVEDFDDLSKTPQYILRFTPNETDLIEAPFLWVVLSKMIFDDNEDFSESSVEKDNYISVHLFENNNDEGMVDLSQECIQQNAFSQELTYTFKIQIPSDKLEKTMNVVITQLNLTDDLYYSIKVVSNINFTISPITLYTNESSTSVTHIEICK